MVINKLLNNKEKKDYISIILDLQKQFYDIEYEVDIIRIKIFCFRNKIKEEELINEVKKELFFG